MPEITKQLKQNCQQTVRQALYEDLNGHDVSLDITANLISPTEIATAYLISRESAVFCGRLWVEETFAQLGGAVKVDWHVNDGDKLVAEQRICTFTGPAREILTGERTALNFVQTLSATATATSTYVAQLAGSETRLLDTRKTIPGLRLAQKYAVLCGGGVNHRFGLYDAFLIKENHILAAGSIANAVANARQFAPEKPVEVEVENNQELQQALDAGADIVMLDNYSPVQIASAVALKKEHKNNCKIEVSGDITLQSISQYAQPGVDFISSGALTKHIRAVDLSLRLAAK
ncbi:carboxylating nicotinate-nucleotide diphosphorylase [Gayadomonas joobiniege]|uniref:carboxylating nicotinate-nucleotide diphosphorylase n=1 Tax=Gayadomonas joobiniege TaxID=1234606 RepID=UPI0003759203|nr:carboxylating nicotinate-nucleotide diphosphorylase [Gayadomonas joobiniege]